MEAMMAKVRPFGNDDTKKSNQDTSKAQDKPEEVSSAGSLTEGEQVAAPSGVDKGTWDQATIAWRNQSGGNGVSDEKAMQDQIRKHYDQMIESDKQAKAWEGKEDS
jgi:hypothetical protein